MAKSYQYTLLIVESPTIASIIRHFNIPYLEVIATHGFCWKPIYDFSNNKLHYRADPDKRDIRRKLKERVPWADMIVVATDTDSAGEFIAFTIRKYLKKHSLKRGYIQNLSKSGILNTIEHSRPFEDLQFQSLINRYVCNLLLEKKLSSKLGKFVWIKLLTSSLFQGPVEAKIFQKLGEPTTNYWFSDKAIKIPFKGKIKIQQTGKSKRYEIKEPWNTADILEKISDNYSSLKQAQIDLNDLFTLVPEDWNHGLISYPRTSSNGYYEQSWKYDCNKWIINNAMESFLPNPLWNCLEPIVPHESIHPIDLALKPSEVRTKMRKKYYDLYFLIYEHHKMVLQMPQKTEWIVYEPLQENIKNSFFSKSSNNNTNELVPLLKISDFLLYLTTYEAARPSGYGQIMDELIADNWIYTNNGCIYPDKKLEKHLQNVDDWETLKNGLDFIKEGIANQLIWPDSKLFDMIQRIVSTVH
ncbi:MAG TPA: hypothetical protein VKA34_11050 [Balneolales bacterium]|nr:hypothetical protein [Balneolales bacterium]